jgi:hypothetical protein
MRGLSTVEWIVNHPLSKGRKAQNIARFFAWQMHSRFIRRPHIFETANGAKMWAISGMTGATGNLYVGLHEFEEMAFLLPFLRRGDLFADVGANVGSYTILAAVAVAVEHQLAHLSSAFHVCPFDQAASVSVDGFGDFSNAALGVGPALPSPRQTADEIDRPCRRADLL